jgi:hypothetical protein
VCEGDRLIVARVDPAQLFLDLSWTIVSFVVVVAAAAAPA